MENELPPKSARKWQPRWRSSSTGGPKPCLAAVLVGEDPASQVYVRNKGRACEKAGIEGRTVRLPADTGQSRLIGAWSAELNQTVGPRDFGPIPAAEARRRPGIGRT